VSEFRFIHPAAPSQLRKYLPAMIGCMSRTRWLRLQVAKQWSHDAAAAMIGATALRLWWRIYRAFPLSFGSN
jgi:hypothetical protein